MDRVLISEVIDRSKLFRFNLRIGRYAYDAICKLASRNDTTASNVMRGMLRMASEYILKEYMSIPLYSFRLKYFNDFVHELRNFGDVLGGKQYVAIVIDYDIYRDVGRIASVLDISINTAAVFLLYFAVFETMHYEFPASIVDYYERMFSYFEMACGRGGNSGYTANSI